MNNKLLRNICINVYIHINIHISKTYKNQQKTTNIFKQIKRTIKNNNYQ